MEFNVLLNSIFILLRNGVVATAAPWVATQQAFEREPATLDWAVLLQCLDGILRTGGCETTRGRCVGRYAILVKLHQRQQRPRGNPFTAVHKLVP